MNEKTNKREEKETRVDLLPVALAVSVVFWVEACIFDKTVNHFIDLSNITCKLM